MVIIGSTLFFQGCASKSTELNSSLSKQEVSTVNDPFEKVNRVVFSFNIIFDKIILRPIAVTYKAVVPGFVRNRITYSLNNLSMPITAVNNLLQG